LFSVDVSCIDQGSINLYNVITPNNDGHNDVLTFDIDISVNTVEILVVDQWGQKVFESANYQNDWAGTKSNGQALAAGIYKYYLKIGEDKYQSPLNIIYN
jgi:gliding motility-associated-like protein